MKHATVRGASGEVRVDDFLNDFQESIDRFEERLKPDYAASAEAAAVLRQASGIHRFFRQQPAGTRGESEWNRLESDLKVLAAAYGTDFLAGGERHRAAHRRSRARRFGRRSRAHADRVKKSLDTELKKDTAMSKEARGAIVSEVDQLVKDAKGLKDRVKDGNPSSAEAERMLGGATKLQAFLDTHQVPASAGSWASVTGPLQSVASAYGAAWPAGR